MRCDQAVPVYLGQSVRFPWPFYKLELDILHFRGARGFLSLPRGRDFTSASISAGSGSERSPMAVPPTTWRSSGCPDREGSSGGCGMCGCCGNGGAVEPDAEAAVEISAAV